jgi:hypothetical protein
VPNAATEPDRARFLGLCASGRYDEAEAMVALVYANGSMPEGTETLARAGFYEEWGDAVAEADPDASRTAYLQAAEFYALYASWAVHEDAGRRREVERIEHKLAGSLPQA